MVELQLRGFPLLVRKARTLTAYGATSAGAANGQALGGEEAKDEHETQKEEHEQVVTDKEGNEDQDSGNKTASEEESVKYQDPFTKSIHPEEIMPYYAHAVLRSANAIG